MNGLSGLIDIEFNPDLGEADRVAQWNQIGSALGALNGGYASNAEYIAFLVIALQNALQRIRLHADGARCFCNSVRLGLAADIDHMRLPGIIKMGELCHGYAK